MEVEVPRDSMTLAEVRRIVEVAATSQESYSTWQEDSAVTVWQPEVGDDVHVPMLHDGTARISHVIGRRGAGQHPHGGSGPHQAEGGGCGARGTTASRGAGVRNMTMLMVLQTDQGTGLAGNS